MFHQEVRVDKHRIEIPQAETAADIRIRIRKTIIRIRVERTCIRPIIRISTNNDSTSRSTL